MDCDLIVVGSGFGGAVTAYRAARAGLRVLVLERGDALTSDDMDAMAAGRKPIFRFNRHMSYRNAVSRGVGAFEITNIPGLSAVVGCGLGGGSRHYTMVTVPPRDEIFDEGWPANWTADSMRPYIARVAERLWPNVDARPFAQVDLIDRAGRALNLAARRVPCAAVANTCVPARSSDGRTRRLADRHGWRTELTGWLRCDAVQRVSLVDAYLQPAAIRGATIRTRTAATRIEPLRTGYAIHTVSMEFGRIRRRVVHAPRVALACGTLGTLRLLLTARDRDRTLPNLSPALGHGFSTNGDCGAILIGRDIRLDHGAAPPAAAWIDAWASDGMLLMGLGHLPVLRRWTDALLRLRYGGGPTTADRAPPRASPAAWIVGVMGRDPARGRVRLDARGRMRHDVSRGHGAWLDRAAARLNDMAHALDARVLRIPTWLARRHPITVHPLGGAALADSPDAGACASAGEVFGHPGLFVVDGAAVPGPTGVPPSMTIAAVAERIVEGLIRRA
jgi:cholesterol oxidase